MHANAARVAAAARTAGLDLEVREFPEGTRTAADAARAIGVEVSQIVKSLVFTVDGDPLLALVAGDARLDEQKLAAAVGGTTVGRADADTVRNATGFPIGGVPPFGHTGVLRTVIDTGLMGHRVVWAAAGTPRHVFPVAPEDLARVTGGAVADVAS